MHMCEYDLNFIYAWLDMMKNSANNQFQFLLHASANSQFEAHKAVFVQ